MGFSIGGFLGNSGPFGKIGGAIEDETTQGTQAARQAADILATGAQEGIAESRAAREQARGDLAPFKEQGADLAGRLSSLVTNTGDQANFLENNPFYKTLADKAQQDILARQAARGKAGSGETTNLVQNKLLQLGTDLLNQNINQQQNVVALGSNAASGQATGGVSSANSITNLLTSTGNAQAAGIVGAQNAQNQRNQGIASGLAAIFASDKRVKANIRELGIHEATGLRVYAFNYIDCDEEEVGFMAQEVQELYPSAVIDINGILYVNYTKVMYAH